MAWHGLTSLSSACHWKEYKTMRTCFKFDCIKYSAVHNVPEHFCTHFNVHLNDDEINVINKRVNFKLRHLSVENLSLINLYIHYMVIILLHYSGSMQNFQHFCHSHTSSIHSAYLLMSFIYCCTDEWKNSKITWKILLLEICERVSIWLRIFVCVCV